ncbi:unnamed protein product [Adineta steineri]|uniref:Methyltransferase type 11 domain-containing protein n=1 Tax=Adineta steineri TaxID=433720 RepID=A0A815MS26_9BILA|nr:unnamed protein product [Adineta steineri]
MPAIPSITDYHLMTIGDDVRLNADTQIQGHSFEQRILKLAPVLISNSCVLMSGLIVMAGCKLTGNNRLYPRTLIMKNEQLSPNTHWKGIPAQSYTVKARLSRSTIAHNDPVKYQQGYETINKMFPWSERSVATKHLPLENESIDIILCIQATHAFDEPKAITQFANEAIRVLRPNGYLLWCDFCYINGSGTSVYDLIASDELIIDEKINITKNVLHALDIQNKSRTDFIQRYIQLEEQEYFRLFAGLPGTQVYEDMSQGRSQYWRVVFQKKTTTDMPVI